MKKIGFWRRTTYLLIVAALTTFLNGNLNADEIVSFQVDPDTIDSNNDGFITGSEFQPIGTDGTVWMLTPTDNLVGADRFLLSETRGLHFGGGGGSTLSFDFEVDQDVFLESYTIADTGFILGDPTFDILEGATLLSSNNTATSNGDTHLFEGGPVELTVGTTYSFQVNNAGAAIQSFMASWEYSAASVPEPGSASILMLSLLVVGKRRRLRCR